MTQSTLSATTRDACLATGAVIALATVVGTMWFIFPLLLTTMYFLTDSPIHFAVLAAVTFAAAFAAAFSARWLLDQLGENKGIYAASLMVALSAASGIGSWWISGTPATAGLLGTGLFLGVGMGILSWSWASRRSSTCSATGTRGSLAASSLDRGSASSP